MTSMTLTLHSLKPAKGSRTKKFRLGRGEGSGRGKTAGKGTKGQRARSGGRKGLKQLGIRPMLLSMPKSRGFKSRYLKTATVRLDQVEKLFDAGARVDLKALKAKGLIHPTSTTAKLVGKEIGKKLTFVNVMASAAATEAVTKAGGSFERTKAVVKTTKVKKVAKKK